MKIDKYSIYILVIVVILGCVFLIEIVSNDSDLNGEAVKKMAIHCIDGIYNEGEEGLDCGWSCNNQCTFIEKCGDITQDETWSGNIHVSCEVIVENGVTLTVEPGTVVKFKDRVDYKNPGMGSLTSNGGTLVAVGTSEEQIWFTSSSEDPINGDWEGINILDSQNNNIIDYAIVEYAHLGIGFFDSSGTVSNSIIRWINSEGIYLERSNPEIINNLFYGVGYNSIAMEQFNYDVLVSNNIIIDNNGAGIHGEATEATVENNILRNNKNGITFDDYSNAQVRFNLIEGSSEEGLHFYFETEAELAFNEIINNEIGISVFESWVVVNNNDIYDNNIALEAYNMHEIDITNNWWGTGLAKSIWGKIVSNVNFLPLTPILQGDSVEITEPVFDYDDLVNFDLGYIPGDPEDRYPYVYDDEDETRRVIEKLNIDPNRFGWSLGWDGEYLWKFKHAGGGALLKVNPVNGDIISEFEDLGIAQDHGIAWDGSSLWINDFSGLEVFEVNPNTGEVISSFEIPEMGSGASGIAWDGQYLYLVNWLEHNQLYKVDRQGNFIEIFELEGEGGQTITYDGEYFWVAGCGKGICKYNTQGNLVGEIYSAAEGTWALAHDGTYLWTLQRTNENWDDPKVYQIEVLNDGLDEVEPCSFDSQFECDSYEINEDNFIMTIENTGATTFTITQVNQYFMDAVAGQHADCPILDNLDIVLSPDEETDIIVPCEILDDYVGLSVEMWIQIIGENVRGLEKTIDGSIYGIVG